jgi:hypothetical protein
MEETTKTTQERMDRLEEEADKLRDEIRYDAFCCVFASMYCCCRRRRHCKHFLSSHFNSFLMNLFFIAD